MDKRVYESNKMLIVRTHQCDKLGFEWERSKLPVIANQSADWCGNPPDREEMYENGQTP